MNGTTSSTSLGGEKSLAKKFEMQGTQAFQHKDTNNSSITNSSITGSNNLTSFFKDPVLQRLAALKPFDAREENFRQKWVPKLLMKPHGLNNSTNLPDSIIAAQWEMNIRNVTRNSPSDSTRAWKTEEKDEENKEKNDDHLGDHLANLG